MELRPLQYFCAALLAFAHGVAWQMPGTPLCAALGWVAALFTPIIFSHQEGTYRSSYVAGLLTNLFGFHWLYHTIKHFGGFPPLASAAIFMLFIVVSALQFPLATLLYRNTPSILQRISLGGAVAWTTSELISIRIFPWYLGHTQLGFPHFAQIADIGGATLISFLMVWLGESLYRLISARRSLLTTIVPLTAFVLTLAYGTTKLREFSHESTKKFIPQKILVAQANVSLESKHEPTLYEENLQEHLALTVSKTTPDTLIIWPETALMRWIPVDVGVAQRHADLRRLPLPAPALIGALTYETPERIFNSAIAIYPNRSIPPPYHKRILMPFGEYTPGTTAGFPSSLIPTPLQRWLRAVNGTAPNFTAGTEATVFSYPITLPLGGGSYTLKAAPLICYEDVVTTPSRESALAGAELLVNLTNDAWFGETAAPLQHHLIASFRAIENRRYLVRATNTGLTGVVSPLGVTISKLDTFTAGTLLAEVRLIGYKSVYTRYSGMLSTLFLVLSCGVALVTGIVVRLRKRADVPTW